MSAKKLDELVRTMENHLECWKQFNHYLALARSKKFEPEDEAQFLEIKSVITQELEIILSGIETSNPSKEDILSLIGGAPSIRYASELQDQSLRTMENQWHKIFIAWQSLLGQLKVQQKETEKKGFWSSLFGK
jgi:hypothetical protein